MPHQKAKLNITITVPLPNSYTLSKISTQDVHPMLPELLVGVVYCFLFLCRYQLVLSLAVSHSTGCHDKSREPAGSHECPWPTNHPNSEMKSTGSQWLMANFITVVVVQFSLCQAHSQFIVIQSLCLPVTPAELCW